MWKISKSFEARVLAFLDSLGFSKLSLILDNMKFETPSTKSETDSKSQFLNVQKRDGGEDLGISCFDHLDFGHQALIRI
jgi:hypothetical protein